MRKSFSIIISLILFCLSANSQKSQSSIFVKISLLPDTVQLNDFHENLEHFNSKGQIAYPESETNMGGLILYMYFKEERWNIDVFDKYGHEVLSYYNPNNTGYFPPCLSYGGWKKEFDQEGSVFEGVIIEFLDSPDDGCVKF